MMLPPQAVLRKTALPRCFRLILVVVSPIYHRLAPAVVPGTGAPDAFLFRPAAAAPAPPVPPAAGSCCVAKLPPPAEENDIDGDPAAGGLPL